MTEPRFRLRFGGLTISYWRHKHGVFEPSRVLRIETRVGIYRIERKDMRLGRWKVDRPKRTQRPEPIQETRETDILMTALAKADEIEARAV